MVYAAEDMHKPGTFVALKVGATNAGQQGLNSCRHVRTKPEVILFRPHTLNAAHGTKGRAPCYSHFYACNNLNCRS